MRRSLSRALLGLLAANAAGILLLAITLLLASARPVAAEASLRPELAVTNLQIGLSVETGTDQPDVAFNGGTVTYTIHLTNTGGPSRNNVLVIDTLPIDTLTNIQCGGVWGCQHLFQSKIIPEPLGGSLLVTITRQLSWTVGTIPSGGHQELVFTGRLGGQADGTPVNNIASVLKVDGEAVSLATAVGMTVRVPIDNQGQPEVSDAATWFSSDLGGTLSQDWGDLNRDGYMDLVLGSSVGPSVFINQDGRLKKLDWQNTDPAYGVRWADFNGDGRLDIVVVGKSEDGSASSPGTNYIYGQFTDATTLSPTYGLSDTFTSSFQLVRVAVGDFDGDHDVDIVASTNSINAPCPVLLYRNNGLGQFDLPDACISDTASAAIGPGDYDNDGDLDLALGLFPDTIKIFVNNGAAVFNVTAIVDDALPFLPYDFAWGDYTADGRLDLAAAFPLQKEARVFRNKKGTTFDPRPFDTAPDLVFRTASFLTPLAVDWGDFNGDGRIDLMVADEAPKVYLNQGGFFLPNAVLASGTQLGQKWGIRGAQLDFGGDLSLSVTNRDRPSLLLEGFASHLASDLTKLNTQSSASVAWGDADNDGDLDFLLGAGSPPDLNTQLFNNVGGTVTTTVGLDLASSGIGPHDIAFGDVDGNRRLDIAVATPGGVQLYLQGAPIASWLSDAASQVAFTDANSDGRLDLLAATAGGGISLYLNQNGTLGSQPIFTTQNAGEVKSLAVADFNRDFYPDFAVAFDDAPARVFVNNKNNTFSQIWNSGTVSQTTSVAWGDFNIDGYLDLAIGNYLQGTQLYQNLTGTLASLPIWSSPTVSRTTALAWGDWDNDGFPDLAIGNEGEPQQVFGNLHSERNLARLYWLWTSDENYNTTDLAWGDVDGDGDLDLGYSQAGGGFNGYYKNGTITPSHHVSAPEDFLRTMPLANNPPYVDVPRPGDTSDAYLLSSSEILGLGNSPTVTIVYEQYDPDGARHNPELLNGDPLARTVFEFSLDGGASWKRASGGSGAPPAATATTRTGVAASFIWDARKDQAISDDARFRIRVVPLLTFGPTQRGSTISVSPPFRIRALAANCIWPDGPNFALSSDPPVPGITTYLTGSLLAGTGPLTYTWQFSDQATPTLGQVTNHNFISATTYAITLTVTGPACPKTRPVVVTRQWGESIVLEPLIYLPFIGQNASGLASGAGASLDEATPTAAATETLTPTATATDEAVPTETGVPTETTTPTETTVPTETATVAPTAGATEPATAEPDPSVTSTPTATTGGSLSAWLVPQVGAGIHSNLGEPTLRTSAAAQLTAAGSGGTVVFITTPDTVGISNEPSVSSDGKYIAFWSTANLVPSVGNSDGNIELFLAQKASPVQYTQVTSSTGSILGGFNLSPSIDESGTRVAFFSDRNLVGQNPESSFQVYLYDSTTATVTQVTTRTRGFNILPSLSGNGQFIAFVSDRNYGAETDGNTEAEGNSEIVRAQLGVSGTLRITPVTTTTNQSNDQPRMDFDGDRIAFVSTADLAPNQNSDHNREVFVATLGPDGVVVYTQVTDTALGNTGQVSISSDGAYVAFVTDQDPDGAGPLPQICLCRVVYRATLDAAGLVTNIQTASNNNTEIGLIQPSISADGTRIAYISTADEQLILHDVVSDAEATLDVAANTLNPAISAGGTAVAFASEKQIMWAEFPLAELTISKSVEPQVAFPGDRLRYTVVVTNSGPSVATGVVVTDVLGSSAFTFATTPDQTDDSAGAGGFTGPGSVHSNTTWSGALTLASGLSGTFTSRVMDGGSAAPWTQLTWRPNRPYGKPLPDFGVNESGYSAGNANQTNIAVLLHLDESGTPETFANTASTVATPAKCRNDLGTCPLAGASGVFNRAAVFNSVPDHLDVDVLPAGGQYAVAFWFHTACPDCGLFQVGRGELGNAARDRQLLLSGGQVCAVLSAEAICSTASVTFDDSQWHHVVHVYGNPAQSGGVQQLYVDGVLRASGVVSTSSVLDDAILNVGYAFDGVNKHFTGSLDELAVFGRSLSATEAQDLYLRGAVGLQFQARTCDLSNCSDGGAFMGPGLSASTWYSEASNTTSGLPQMALDGLPVRRYFQYQAVLTTTAAAFPPRLEALQVGPSHGAVETHQGTCNSPNPGQTIVCSLNDLEANDVATITISLTPTTYGALTNVAGVTSNVDEHDLLNVASATPNVLPLPIEVFTLNLAGVPGLAGTGTTFTATVGPITASTPITYMWQATNQTPFTRSGGLTNSAVLTWFTGGPQVVTVTAINAANVLSGTPGLTATLAFTVSNPVPVLTAISPNGAPINSSDVTVLLTGTKFVGNSEVRWNGGTQLSRTVGSTTSITATVPASLLATPGQFPITVFNPLPAGGTSAPFTFTVAYPTPSNLVLSPTSVFAGGHAFSLTVTGNGLYPGATLYWNGSPRTTVVNSATQTLSANITVGDINMVGTAVITVTNLTPNSGPSAQLAFTRTAPTLTLEPESFSMGLNAPAVMTASLNAVQAADRTILLVSSNSTTVSVNSTVVLPANTTSVTFTVQSGALGGLVTLTGTLPINLGSGTDQSVITVLNPQPDITGTTPSAASAGGISLAPLKIFGTGFVPGVQVYWNGTLLPSTLTGGVIDAQVNSSLIALANTAIITAANPAPNSGASADFPFTINQPTLTLTPADVTTNVNSSVTMTATTDTPRALATVITVTSSSPTVASVPTTVTIPAGSASINFNLTAGATGGNAVVTATLPATYGLVSDSSTVVVNNLAPVIRSLTPSVVTAGAGGFTLIIVGDNFANNAKVLHDGTAFSGGAVTFGNANLLTVTVPADVIANAGFIDIQVHNQPPPGGGLTSLAAVLTVNNPAPVIGSVSPTTATVGGPGFTLNVNGSNFVSGAQLFFNGAAHATSVSGSTGLTASIGFDEIDTIGTVNITMTNPAPTFPSLSSVPFTITQLGLTLFPTGTFTVTGGDSATLTVTLNAVQAGPTVITTTVSQIGILTMPPTVTVPAGQLSTSFAITTTNADTVTLSAQLPAGLGGATSDNTLVILDAPLANFVVGNDGPKDRTTPQTNFNFTSTIEGTNAGYVWNFGDGAFGSGANPNHQYSALAGQVYTVVVTATNTINELTGTTLVYLNNLTPTLTAIGPVTFPVTTTSKTLFITGTNFYTGTQVRITGAADRVANTAFGNTTSMSITLTATDLDTSGLFTVSIVSAQPPIPGRVSTNAIPFRVVTPITGLTASSNGPVDWASGGSQVTLSADILTGDSPSWTWNPGDGTTPVNFSGPALSADLVHTYTAATGTIYTPVVTVTNAVSGPFSLSITVSVNNLTPTISAFSPLTQAGGAGFTIRITGTNFISGTTVTGTALRWNGSATLIDTTWVSSTVVTASIPASSIPTAGGYTFQLVAPAPGTPRRESPASSPPFTRT